MRSARFRLGWVGWLAVAVFGGGGSWLDCAAAQDPLAAIQASGGSVLKIAQDSDDLEVTFNLSDREIGDAQLEVLQQVPQLIWLNLANTKITDDGLRLIAPLARLQKLHLEKTGIGDAGLQHLAQLAELEYLNLHSTQVSDAGLVHLQGLKKLKRLYLWQTKVTDAGVATLKAALPELYVNVGAELVPPPAPEPNAEKPAETPPAEPAPAADKKEGDGGKNQPRP